jgi:hypothetical protein
MDLTLRDLAVEIELKTRALREMDRNGHYGTDVRHEMKYHLLGVQYAKGIALAAMKKVERLVPVDFHQFIDQVREEAMARVLQAEPPCDGGDPPKRPDENALLLETLRMFHECALLCGVMPEPRLPSGTDD